ncbi:MAG: acyltransferase family protein [Actinomycetota bacterium]
MSNRTVLTPPPEFKIPRPPKAAGAGSNASNGAASLAVPSGWQLEMAALTERKDHLEYMPTLDGLRALAVIAVLAYHGDQTWARAGFLGVDIFFVISGYLITALLLSEFRQQGRISIVNFWRRRALRLLPSLLVMLATVSVVVPILAPDQLPQLRGDLVAALTYVSNWRMIFQDLPYFQAMGRPPILQHLWSLAVEEQFYLFWPLVLALALRRDSANKSLIFWIVLVAAVSAVAMAMMYSPETNVSRAYYGTDTRVGTVLLGAALAFVWMPGQRSARPRRMGSAMRDVAGLGSVGLLAWIIYSWNEFNELLYLGGFSAVALLSMIAVAVSAHPGWLSRHLLGNPPMRWLGRRSYAIYLWHWPVFMLTRPNLDVDLTGYPLLTLRLGITLVLATATYHLVEKPVRNGALGSAWSRLRSGLVNRTARPAFSGMAVLLAPALITAAVGVGIANDGGSPASSLASFGGGPAEDPPDQNPEQAPNKGLPASDEFAGISITEVPVVPEVPPAGPPIDPNAPPAPPPVPQTVTALGDSVMLIARDELVGKFGAAALPANVDAAIGRQTKSIIEIAQTLRDAGQLGNNVIVHTGTNGPISHRQLEALMDLLKDVPRVFLVNVKVARPWESVNNQLLADNIARWPNARLVDWSSAAHAHPEAFYRDGVHLRPKGIQLYVDLLTGSIFS